MSIIYKPKDVASCEQEMKKMEVKLDGIAKFASRR